MRISEYKIRLIATNETKLQKEGIVSEFNEVWPWKVLNVNICYGVPKR